MSKRKLVVAIAAGVLALGAASSAFAAENWLGGWKMDAAKSTFSPGPALKVETLKFEKGANGITLTSDWTDVNGKTVHTSYTAKFDGSVASWTGNPDADSCAPKKIDDNNYTNTWKKGDKVTMNAKVSVSADGKTLSLVQTGTSHDGKRIHNMVTFTRQ